MPRKKVTKKPFHKKVRHSVKSVMVPHVGNQYRPHLVRRHGLVFVLLLVMTAFGIQNFHNTGSVLGRVTDVTRQRLLETTNNARLANNSAPLELNETLNQAAQAKAANMFEEQYWSHSAPSGYSPWHWVTLAGYKYEHAGENLAKGFVSSQGVTTAWLNSEEHRKNLLDQSYRDVGFAVQKGHLNGEETTIVVALYGRPSQQAQLASAQVLAAENKTLSPIARIGIALQSMTPVMLGSLLMMIGVVMVSLGAHAYRNRLPKALRQNWYRHHGLYKGVGMSALILLVFALYGGGQI